MPHLVSRVEEALANDALPVEQLRSRVGDALVARSLRVLVSQPERVDRSWKRLAGIIVRFGPGQK